MKIVVGAVLWLACVAVVVSGQALVIPKDSVRWCAVGDAEMLKCQEFAEAVRLNGQFELSLNCVRADAKEECLHRIDKHLADLVTLDPGDVFVGGRYHSLVPIMREKYGPSADQFYYAVAVVKRVLPARSLEELRGRKACFTGVGQLAGWVYPIATLIRTGVIPVTDCNNHVKTAAAFFGASCAPNSLLNKYNPTGDNPLSMCELCGDQGLIKCLDSSMFAGFGGAMRCLSGGRGDVAFVKHTTIEEMASQPGLDIDLQDYELLCPTGGRAPVGGFSSCNWGQVPSHAVVTSSVTPPDMRRRYQRFMKEAVFAFGAIGGPVPSSPARRPAFFPGSGRVPVSASEPGSFRLFRSADKYGNNHNLLFQDTTTQIEPIADGEQTFKDFLGKYEEVILELRKCPVESVKFCVVSEMEMDKCMRMKIALRAQFLKPEVICFRGRSQRDCMVSIANGNADLAVFDAGDIYTAGKHFGLIPILSEQYNLDGPFFYAVAVARIEDPETDLLFVRGKFTCHTGMGMGAGWIMPVTFLLKNKRLRDHGCDGVEAAAEFFQKSCVPGAMSPEYNMGFKQDSLCDLCYGTGSRFCKRDHSEDFFGYTGAFRCLIEGGGQIAFVKHTTIYENTNGNNQLWWSRNMLSEDFELLCRDGSRTPASEYERCNLGKVPSNAMVSRGDNLTVIDYYVNLFLYAQEYYGSKNDEDFRFRLFYSEFPNNDLIFQDATQQLVRVDPEKWHYKDYLGYEFTYAARAVDCTSSAGISTLARIAIVAVVLGHVSARFFG